MAQNEISGQNLTSTTLQHNRIFGQERWLVKCLMTLGETSKVTCQENVLHHIITIAQISDAV